MKDKFGNKLEIGDYIVYAGSVGHTPDLKVGIVKEFFVRENVNEYLKYQMRVRGVNTSHKGELELNTKDGRIGGHAAIKTNDIPLEIKAMLDVHLQETITNK